MAASLSSSSSPSYRKKRRRRSKSRSHRSRRQQRWRSSSGSLPRRDERLRKKRRSTSRSSKQSSSSSSLLRKSRKRRKSSPSQSSGDIPTPAEKRVRSTGSSDNRSSSERDRRRGAKDVKEAKDAKETDCAKEAKDAKKTKNGKVSKKDDDDALPSGWSKLLDPDNKECYYWDKVNKKASRERPTEPAKKKVQAQEGPPAKKAKRAKEAKEAKVAKRAKEAKSPKDAKEAKERSKKSPSLGKPNGKRAPFDDSAVGKNGSTATDRKNSSPEKDAKTNGKRLPFDHAAVAAAAVPAIQGRKPGTQLAGLGDLGALQRSLDEERQRLTLFVIKAKQEWEERRERRSASGVTDDKDYYQASIGEIFGPNKQFQIEEKIGKGMFSSVFKCKDTSGGVDCAVKVIRNAAIMRRVSEKEVEVYRHLASKASKEDPDGARHVINLIGETFEHKGHLCLVFGLLKCDLRFALKKYGMGKGLQLGTIQQYGQQLFLALRVLRRLKLIHGDLKPDNVLMSTDKTVVQLIDFGSAMNVSETITNTPYVQPRYYRAPEVILGIPYDTQVDVWSLAVTLFELATTKLLYQGACNNSMIKHMLEVCGAFPKSLRSAGKFVTKHFNSDGDFLCRDSRDNGSQAKKMAMEHFGTHAKPLRPVQGKLEAELVEPPDGVDGAFHKAMVEHFAGLVSSCCKPDHSKRITPEQALKHAFFKPPQS